MIGTTVIKVGGSVLKGDAQINRFATQIAALAEQGQQLVIVHGGGPHINEHLLSQGIAPHFIDGQRVTDDDTLMSVFAALGQVNTKIVSALQHNGLSAAALHAEPNLFSCAKKKVFDASNGKSSDLGWVGQITHTAVDSLLKYSGSTLVISPIGWDDNRNRYNINADHAAFALATALQSDALIFLSDVPGVLSNACDPDSLIPLINKQMIELLIAEEKVSGGMVPKLTNSLAALDTGVNSVSIIDGQNEFGLIETLTGKRPIGTTITSQPVLLNHSSRHSDKGQDALFSNSPISKAS